ncbi:hypothetical protein HK096_009970, partial [Nowakowskiella sp. JEL0078]
MRFPAQLYSTNSGRKIAYSLLGNAPNPVSQILGTLPSAVILYMHGFPSSRLEAKIFDSEAKKNNALIISVDRPGFGQSDFDPSHTINSFINNDVPDLVSSVALELFGKNWIESQNRPKFSILGVSGGGPYTCSALYHWTISPIKTLPPIHSVVLAAAMPLGMGRSGAFSNLPWFARLNWNLFNVLPRSWLAAFALWQRGILLKLSEDYLSGDEEKKNAVIRQMKFYSLPKDFEALTKENEGFDNMQIFMEMVFESYFQHKSIFAESFSNAAKEYFVDPGFSLKDVPPQASDNLGSSRGFRSANVHIFSGGSDMQVPKEMGDLLNREIIGSEFHFYKDESHISLLVNQKAEIF